MNFDKILTPELKNSIDDFSNKMKQQMEANSELKPNEAASKAAGDTNQNSNYGENLGSLLGAFQNILKDDPKIVDRTLNTLKETTGGQDGIMGMLSGILGGGGGGGTENGIPSGFPLDLLGGINNQQQEQQQIEPSFQVPDEDNYIEKQVILPTTHEEIENEVEKKFRLRLHPNEPERKTMYKLKLERDTYVYSFWYFSDVEGEKNTLVRIALKLPDSETVVSSDE